MSKRILAVGNGDELLEQVNGRVFRHVWDERSKRYLIIQEDGASAYAARLRKVGIRVNDPARFEQATQRLDEHYESMAATDLDATHAAASDRWGY